MWSGTDSPLAVESMLARWLRALADGAIDHVALGTRLQQSFRELRDALAPLAHPAPMAPIPYSRRVFPKAAGEAMLAHWAPGAACLPHDHGAASGAVLVLTGRLEECGWRLDADGLASSSARIVVPGDVLTVVPRAIHAMRALDGALTLHLYAPTTAGMRLYDIASRSIVTVADDCGAWLPDDPGRILRREPLGGGALHDALP